LPERATRHASCFDVSAAHDGAIGPGARMLVKTGIAVEVPPGYEVQIRPRSGLALRHGISLVNGPATIDADYRGELGVILINHGTAPFAFKAGDRIAQIGVYPVVMCAAEAVAELSPSERGEGGYGHSGTSAAIISGTERPGPS
jgi:dUTP pyrophosphatase